MKNLLDKLLRRESEDGEQKSFLKIRYFIIVGLVGILILLISNIFSEDNETHVEQEIGRVDSENIKPEKTLQEGNDSEIAALTESYQRDLVNMLNNIQGVSEAEVMVNLDSSDIKVYERNLISGTQTTDEEDQSGGVRKVQDQTEEAQVVFIRQGDQEVPVLVQTKRPEVRGVFVVAKGAEQASVKSWITEAISSVMDVPTHRISVMPKQ